MDYQTELNASLEFLASPAALEMLAADAYWPKWDSPWWHMSLLHEMGLTHRIPERIIRAHLDAMNRIPFKAFPIQPGELPADVDPYRGSPCHCQLGNVFQVHATWGIDVDAELPWLRPWFHRYQMADGGLNCDNDAYLVTDETPSSMVGTIAIFESMLLIPTARWTEEDRAFVARGARFLMNRQLRLGSPTKHNSDERESAQSWGQLCFPRFYLYDTLRGLSALLRWSEVTGEEIPRDAVAEVVTDLARRFPDGRARIGRHAYAGAGSLVRAPSGEWLRRQPATYFPLLTKLSAIGEESPFLSRQWQDARALLRRRGFHFS